MKNLYQKLWRKNISLSPLGIQLSRNIHNASPENETRKKETFRYFCTPKRAKIIGSAGVDGIHYCFVHGFGEMVFAVSPMNLPGEYVHPLAENFTDFLRLLLACGTADALEQVWQWSREDFHAYVQENPVTPEQQEIFDRIQKTWKLSPMPDPYGYIRNLQDSFDYSRIKFDEDYAEWVPVNPPPPKKPKWAVYFYSGFWGKSDQTRAGKEIPVHTSFDWAEKNWSIPAVYSCAAGLVIDFCMRIDPEEIQKFIDQWDILNPVEQEEPFSADRQMRRTADNPLCLDFNVKVMVNKRELSHSRSYGISWNPLLPPEDHSRESRWTIEHYGLDPSCGWMITRCAFPWATKRRPNIKKLSVTLNASPVTLPATHFHISQVGACVDITHPVTQETFTLQVQNCESQTFPEEAFQNSEYDMPRCFTALTYTITPDLPYDALYIEDCAKSDQPRSRQPSQSALLPTAKNDVCAAIIGGADGPVSIATLTTPGPNTSESEAGFRTACSALHFEPVRDTGNIEWRTVFRVKRPGTEELTLNL